MVTRMGWCLGRMEVCVCWSGSGRVGGRVGLLGVWMCFGEGLGGLIGRMGVWVGCEIASIQVY